jgi:hypothetical protein
VFASTCSSCCGITITLPEAPWPPANLQYKPLGEPAIDLRQHLLGVFLLALFLGISSHDGWTRIKENTLKRNQFIDELVASFTKWPKSCKDKRLSDSLWDHHRT